MSKEVINEAVKAVGKEVYGDLAKPAVKSVGEMMGLVPRAIKAALLPLEKWILQRENNLEITRKLLEEKLANISPEQIVEPEAHIAVPTLQYLEYCMDNETLRDMYANLLAKSMDTVTKDGVHPSCVEIIKQLCPDEARILNYLSAYESFAVVSIRYNFKEGGATVYENFSNIGEIINCEFPYRINSYIVNLERLGLVKISPPLTRLLDESLYDSLKAHPFVLKLKTEMPDSFEKATIEEGYVGISSFGEGFCRICVDPAIQKPDQEQVSRLLQIDNNIDE